MNKKLLACLSLFLTTSFLGACDEVLKETQTPEILITSSGALVTKESGEAATFLMTLTGDPGREVAISVLSSDTSEGVVEPSEVTLDASNWFVPISFTITGLSDGIVDGDIEYKVRLSEKTDVIVAHTLEAVELDVNNIDIDHKVIVDPDLASFKLSSTTLLTREGGSGVDFSLALGSKPAAEVVVRLHASDESEGSLSKETLSFSTDNWQHAQTVTVNPLADGIVDGDQDYLIEFAVSSGDARFNAYKIAPIEVKNVDVFDLIPASFALSSKSLLTREGGAAVNFSLALGSKPTDGVVVTISVSDESEGSLSPSELRFSADNWEKAQVVTVTPLADGIVDGDQDYAIEFGVSSADERYNAYKIAAIAVRNIDVDYASGSGIPIRVVAGNITSGRVQSYDDGDGIRIFKALKPDIVMIQEFNMESSSLGAMVADTFGPEFQYTVGHGKIPNGVISRFPIIEHGAWDSNITSDRDWDWAVIDLPGPKDVLVVSVHLNTGKHDKEMQPLKDQIQAKLAKGNYYVLLGGDFNTKTRGSVERVFPPILEVKGPYPVDQDNKDGTNSGRTKSYDWVLCCPAWAMFEVPVVIGSHSYPHGHVFDSRVYEAHGELGDVAPVEAGDSASANMQHMAVVRDFLFRY